MKPWESLSEPGRIRRLRSVAFAALEAYPVAPTRITLVGGFTNIIFRVDTSLGPYALRVDRHQEHTDQDVEIELAWLAELESTSSLDVARFVSASDGRPFVYAGAEGVPGVRRCVLFHWVPGKTLFDHLSNSAYERLGRLSAGLIQAGAVFDPPSRPMAWDRVFYWPEAVDPVVVYEDRFESVIGERRPILDAAIEAVSDGFARLDPSAAQVVHGDIHPWNVHIYRSRTIAIDFEDVMWAHPIQDVAITLSYLREEPAYPGLKEAYIEGFESVADWPEAYEGELEHFMAARQIMFVNYLLNLERDPSEYFDRIFTRLESYLRTVG